MNAEKTTFMDDRQPESEVKPQPQVQLAMRWLGQSTDTLNNELEKLLPRLVPVLRNSPANTKEPVPVEDNAPKPFAPLAQQISDYAYQVRSVSLVLRDLNARLEV